MNVESFVTRNLPFVISHPPANPRLVFRVAALQMEPRFFVAFLVQVMQQRRIAVTRELFREFIQPRENRQETWFWIRRRHVFDRFGQLGQRRQQFKFDG